MNAIELKVYSYNELSQNAKEKAKDNYHDYFCFSDYSGEIIDYWLEKYNVEKYFYYKKAYFSGFWSQGDGAMFEYYNLESDLIKEAINSLDIKKSIKDIMYNTLRITAKSEQSGHYYHQKSVNHNLDIYIETNSDVYANLYSYTALYTDEIKQYIIDKYDNLCSELYTMLENEYEMLTNEESISMFYEDNGTMFFEDGTVYNF
ncbi:MAG: hypothetical protein GX896_06035 [Clostridiales bacterium]|nr:hypothetical protein [Clostridiales bacterium]